MVDPTGHYSTKAWENHDPWERLIDFVLHPGAQHQSVEKIITLQAERERQRELAQDEDEEIVRRLLKGNKEYL